MPSGPAPPLRLSARVVLARSSRRMRTCRARVVSTRSPVMFSAICTAAAAHHVFSSSLTNTRAGRVWTWNVIALRAGRGVGLAAGAGAVLATGEATALGEGFGDGVVTGLGVATRATPAGARAGGGGAAGGAT